MGSLSKAVKKIAKPKVLLPLAAIALGGPALAGAMKAGSAGAALTGTAGKAALGASAAAAPGSLMGSAMVAPSLAAGSAAAVPATAGLFGTAGAFAPLKGTLAKGIMYGLKNPFTTKGLMTYGGAGLGLAGLMGKEKTEAQKNLGVDAQAQYDLAREMNRMMGGAYTDEQLNTITAPMLSQYGGEYETITNPMRKRRPMFPGLNYSGLTRYAPEYADGGTIVGDDELSQKLFSEMMGAQMSDNVPEDMFNPINPMNPMGGPHKEEDIGIYDVLEAFDQKNKEIMDFKRRQKTEGQELRERVYNSYIDRYKQMLEGPAGPSMPPMKSFEEMFPVEEKAMGGRIGMNMGGGLGSIPQTPMMPQGMQLDGRGGGFIPMGAQEKKDDVPAMLAKNEFVMTSDAVRAAGGGDINKGAQKMYDLMNNLESKV